MVRANRRSQALAPEWALAYRETNALIADITRRLKEALSERGVRAAAEPPTHNFDPVTLACRWSHKSAAAIAGLGTFGLHRLLITEAGCAGRFGSLALDAEIPPTPPPDREFCLHFAGAKCRACVEGCPTGALEAAGPSEQNLDKQRCWEHLLRVEAQLGADCCGKCSVGPCAVKAPLGRG